MTSIDNANNAPRCEHIKFDGKRCGAPALHGRDRCRFHYSVGDFRAPFPMIEDTLSLQVALNQIARAVLDGSLERKTATTLLYCFQIMSTNFKQMNAERKLTAKQDEDDLPGPSLAEILLDKLKELESEEDELSARSPSVPPVTQNSDFVIPSAAQGPSASSGVAPQSAIDNRQSAMPFSSSAPPAPPAVKRGVIDKLHAATQSSIDNRQSPMPFGSLPLPPRLQ